jgi:hypothetical protein
LEVLFDGHHFSVTGAGVGVVHVGQAVAGRDEFALFEDETGHDDIGADQGATGFAKSDVNPSVHFFFKQDLPLYFEQGFKRGPLSFEQGFKRGPLSFEQGFKRGMPLSFEQGFKRGMPL